MTTAEDIRARLKGTNPETIATREAMSAQDQARAREMKRWDERARKSMKVFEGTLADITAETRSGVYERGNNAGQSWSTEVAVCIWEDVNCIEGEATSTTEFRLPESGKEFSRYSEAANTVRLAQEANPEAGITDYTDLIGKRLRMEGTWEPSFLGDPDVEGRRYWNGTYCYRPIILDAPVKAPEAPKPDSVKKLAEWCVGKEPSEVTNASLARAAISLGIQSDAPLMKMLGEPAEIFLAYASAIGLVVGEDGKFAIV